jgi:hypothetical protein
MLVFLRLLAGACALVATISLARPPNILFVLTDDQGSSSLSCYGGTHVATPHLDALAREGVRFTDAYVMPQCTPTRAALLSGQHTARNGMWHVIPWYGSPWAPVTEPAFREQFPREAFSLAKGLSPRQRFSSSKIMIQTQRSPRSSKMSARARFAC